MIYQCQPNIELHVNRCFDCGRFYAVEVARNSTCPYCAREEVRQANARADTAERSAAASRGVIKRLRRVT